MRERAPASRVPFSDRARLRGLRAPGTYDWHTKSASAAVLAGTHAVAIRVRQGTAEVKLDGVVALTGPVSTGFAGWFGFAASSGAEIGTFVVRSFDATFYECDDP